MLNYSISISIFLSFTHTHTLALFITLQPMQSSFYFIVFLSSLIFLFKGDRRWITRTFDSSTLQQELHWSSCKPLSVSPCSLSLMFSTLFAVFSAKKCLLFVEKKNLFLVCQITTLFFCLTLFTCLFFCFVMLLLMHIVLIVHCICYVNEICKKILI